MYASLVKDAVATNYQTGPMHVIIKRVPCKTSEQRPMHFTPHLTFDEFWLSWPLVYDFPFVLKCMRLMNGLLFRDCGPWGKISFSQLHLTYWIILYSTYALWSYKYLSVCYDDKQYFYYFLYNVYLLFYPFILFPVQSM